MKTAWPAGLLSALVGAPGGGRGMVDVAGVLARWTLDALWLLAQGGSANQVAELLERGAHTIGGWLAAFARGGPAALAFEQTDGPPPPSGLGRRPG